MTKILRHWKVNNIWVIVNIFWISSLSKTYCEETETLGLIEYQLL